jgi:hypothetical protein
LAILKLLVNDQDFGLFSKSKNAQFYSFTHPDQGYKLMVHIHLVVVGVNEFWRPVIIYEIRWRFRLRPKPRYIIRSATKLQSATFGK